MKRFIILFFVVSFFFKISPLNGMQELVHSTGSALVVGGGALFVQGVYRQHEVFMPRLYPSGEKNCMPLRIDDWIKYVAMPLVGGGAMFSIGVFLMITSKVN